MASPAGTRPEAEHWIRDGERSEAFLESLRNEPELLVASRTVSPASCFFPASRKSLLQR